MSWRRIKEIITKEIIQARRDRRMMMFIFVTPLLQIILLGYAVSGDITHIATAVYDQDRTVTSREFIQRFIASGYFDYDYYLSSSAQIDPLLQSGKAQFVLVIPYHFTKDLARGHTAQIQTLYDGTDSSTARTIAGYTDAIVQTYGSEIVVQRASRIRAIAPRVSAVDARVRVWYNPDLESVNFLIPGLMTTILLFVTTTLTSTAIVKEKELGTLEQLIVTPIMPLELMIGKTAPFMLIGLIELTMTLLVALFWFHVRMTGSILLLYCLSLLFLNTTLGIGTLISTLSQTQQESSLTGVFFLLPMIMLSGYIFPIANMPPAIQVLTYIDPVRYYLQIIRGIFLKGIGLEYLWPQTLALAAIGAAILLFSANRFSKRLK